MFCWKVSVLLRTVALLGTITLCLCKLINLQRLGASTSSSAVAGQSACLHSIRIDSTQPDSVFESFDTLSVFVELRSKDSTLPNRYLEGDVNLSDIELCHAFGPKGKVMQCALMDGRRDQALFLWGQSPGQHTFFIRSPTSSQITTTKSFAVQRSDLPLPASPTLHKHLFFKLDPHAEDQTGRSYRHAQHQTSSNETYALSEWAARSTVAFGQNLGCDLGLTILVLSPAHTLIAPPHIAVYTPGASATASRAPTARWAACHGDFTHQPLCIVSSDVAGVLSTCRPLENILNALGVSVDALVPPHIVAPACMLTWWAWHAPHGSVQYVTARDAWVQAASCGDEVPLVYQLDPPQLGKSVLSSKRQVRKSESSHAPCTHPHVLRDHVELSSLLPAHSTCVTGESPTTLLTVFTTLVPRRNQTSPQAQQKSTIQSSVIRALAALRPHVALVVFTDDPGIAQEVRDLGAAAVTDGFRAAPYGAPYLRDMYTWVRQHSQSPFYGFMNADILFGPDLVDAVDVVLRGIANGTLSQRVLVTGRRFNVQMPLPFVDGHAWSVRVGATALDISRIHYSMREGARVFVPWGLDFFFITRGTWDWSIIPDFAPGRGVYDTWLSDHSFRDLVPRIEISRCVWPLHLSGSDGHFSGTSTDLSYPDFNERKAETYIGGVKMGILTTAEWRLEAGGGSGACQLVPGTGRMRVGDERGWPWTGKLREGHVDPITGNVSERSESGASDGMCEPL